ncbi:PREDICTED: odorant receptor 13a-like [Vollenhovia emeryi]|uniref:odorant receptor 13a-like n=1 Tax=Vollenhovia emeryi TaxID=411798 RepID=UPI0005F52F41|nr:PREDICTED: odorant receptor 13a-like [Vollenhovia emeryi]
MEHSRAYYYDISKKYLMLVGQWPYQKPKERLTALLLTIILATTSLVPQGARFVICKNAQCIYETLPPYMLGVMILVKIFTYQFNSEKIKDLTDRLFVDWDILETKEEHDIMRKYAERGRWYALIYGLFVYVSTVIFATTSLVPRILDVLFPLNASRPLKLPYPAYYFVDENQYFFYIFLHMMIACTICMTGLVAHDTMFFVYVEHICGLFAIVGFRFEHVSSKCSIMEKNIIDHPEAMYHKNVVISIYAHHKALQFTQFLESAFMISFAVQLLFVTIGLSITLVQLSIQLQDSAEAIRYILFIFGQLFHLFCFSFQGQKVIDHSLETRDKIYRGSWYTIPVREQRLLMFVMRKSIEASTLTAGKIYVFSLENFTTIVQSSMSYFTLLSSFDVS